MREEISIRNFREGKLAPHLCLNFVVFHLIRSKLLYQLVTLPEVGWSWRFRSTPICHPNFWHRPRGTFISNINPSNPDLEAKAQCVQCNATSPHSHNAKIHAEMIFRSPFRIPGTRARINFVKSARFESLIDSRSCRKTLRIESS